MKYPILGIITVFLVFYWLGYVTTPDYSLKTVPTSDVVVAGASSSIPNYSRAYFKHWSDLDHDGEDTREELLKGLDIDHIIPLKGAWISGAYSWTPAQREQFANDPDNLQVLPASINRSKSDKDITEWLPTYDRCAYARKYLYIKHKYKLEVSPQELDVETKVCKVVE